MKPKRCGECGLTKHPLRRDPEAGLLDTPLHAPIWACEPCDRIPIGGWPHKEAGWSRKQQ